MIAQKRQGPGGNTHAEQLVMLQDVVSAGLGDAVTGKAQADDQQRPVVPDIPALDLLAAASATHVVHTLLHSSKRCLPPIVISPSHHPCVLAAAAA